MIKTLPLGSPLHQDQGMLLGKADQVLECGPLDSCSSILGHLASRLHH